MKRVWTLLMVAIGLLIAGCHGNTVQSVDWYMAHDTARKAMIQKCQAMPKAEVSTNANCSHAVAAVRKAENQAKPWINMPMKPNKKG